MESWIDYIYSIHLLHTFTCLYAWAIIYYALVVEFINESLLVRWLYIGVNVLCFVITWGVSSTSNSPDKYCLSNSAFSPTYEEIILLICLVCRSRPRPKLSTLGGGRDRERGATHNLLVFRKSSRIQWGSYAGFMFARQEHKIKTLKKKKLI